MAKNKLKNHIGQVSCVSYGLSWRRCFFHESSKFLSFK